MVANGKYKRIAKRVLAVLLSAMLVFLPLMAVALAEDSQTDSSIAPDAYTQVWDEMGATQSSQEVVAGSDEDTETPPDTEKLEESENPTDPKEYEGSEATENSDGSGNMELPDDSQDPETPEPTEDSENPKHNEGSENSELTEDPETPEPTEGLENEEDPENSENPEMIFVYDEQPQSLEEVQAYIDNYNQLVSTAMENEGEQAALTIPKPRWEFMVEDELMPEGYYCGLVEDDEEFGAEYYTFFEEELLLRAAMAQDADGYYLIETPADLDAMRNDLSASYRLAKDINLNGYISSTSTAAQGWQGIGSTEARPFTGELDGQNYTISGLRSTYPAVIAVGLFRYAKGAYIHDVNLVTDTNGSGNVLSAGYKVGTLVGSMDNTRVENCNVEINGGLSVTSYTIGGVVGLADDHSVIRNCHVVNNQTISAKTEVGGIVGNAGDGTLIEDCTMEGGTLSSSGRLGGIVGVSNVIQGLGAAVRRSNVAQVVIRNCGVDGKGQAYIGAGDYISGLVGASYNTNISGCTVQNLTLKGANYTAGLAGKLAKNSTLEDSHVDNVTVEGSKMYTGGAVGYTYESTGVQINNCTVQNAKVLGGTYKTGGLVGLAEKDASISNCHVWNIEVQGKEEVGGLVGKLWDDATISNSSVRSFTVEGGTGGMTGGMVGEHLGTSQIWNSYVMDGVVTGLAWDTGGFTGKSYGNARIENCFSEADVVFQGTSPQLGLALVGGFSGKLDGNAVVTNCYATGNVRAETNTANLQGFGSFTGALFGSPKVTNCYGAGTVYVRVSQKNVGGFTGHKSPDSTITNCYFDTTTTTQRYGVGDATVGGGSNPSGVTPLTTQQMVAGTGANGSYIQFAYQNTQTQSGSQSNPWYIDPGLTYPYLYYQYNGLTKPETAYGLSTITYSDGAYLTDSRMDFTIGGTLPFRVLSDGAAWAYFPFANNSMHPVSQIEAAVPGTSYSPGNNLYSIGGISQSGIVGFSNVPIATKTSNRPVWQNNQPSTYTYVGDLATYTISAKNYSAVYNWDDVVMRDPLHAGLSLQVDLGITLRYGQGGTPIPLPKGDAGDPLPYYQYNEASNTLSVHLDSPLYSTESGSQPTEAFIEFTVLVGRDAATRFKPDGSWDGDNIRNRGTVTGTLKTSGGAVVQTFTARFDDRNTDPVYDKWIVTYISNYDMNGTVGADDTQVVGGYYLMDASQSHLVWENEAGPGNFTGFALATYEFVGWYYFLADGTRVNIAPGDTLANVNRDIFLFADWQLGGAEFEFYKVNSAQEPLAGAVFTLYQWKGGGPPGDTELVSDAAVASGDWEEVGEYTSQVGSGGQGLPITLYFTETGIYQMLEKTAPSGYQQPAGQWRFSATVEAGDESLTGPSYIRGPLPHSTIRNPLLNDGTQWIFENYRIVPFAFKKISTPLLDKPQPYAVALEGAALILYIWADPNTQPGSNTLVTEQTIADGQWLEYAHAVSDGNGDVAFPLTDYAATYQLVEETAPEFYQLPTGQWRFSVSNGDTVNEIIDTITAIPGTTGEIPPAFKVINATELGGEFAGDLALVNFPDYTLPTMGGKGVWMFLLAGGLMIALGIVLLLLRRARRIATRQRRYMHKIGMYKRR